MMDARAIVLTVCGLGYLRPAPGTWGSLPPVVACLAYIAAGLPIAYINFLLVLLAVIAGAACLEFGSWAEQRWKGKDPSEVVADEVCGQSITLLMLPWREMHEGHDWLWNITLAMLAFFTFRIMDIIKPHPARTSQRLPGGEGILFDDVIAGVYALLVVQVIARFALDPAFALLR